ncbi:imm11 family protein [Sphingomonas azotifigens]|uniref:imm11 family protein n=1 Tax=Sphingomonas azotifigens TaxID=330920 RepID=UPI0009FF7E97|nr:DUF1629 domain-containing protein [Sphingomonas azotifigens]
MSEKFEKAIEYLHIGPMAYKPETSGRKFFEVRADRTIGRLPFDVVNEEEVGFYKPGPYPGGIGFPIYQGVPILRFNPRRKRIPDLNQYGRLWIVSDRAKNVLARVDPEAFEFRPTESVRGGKPLERDSYWLCAPIRILDAVDEDRSEIWIGRLGDNYTYPSLHLARMRLEVVGDAHAFCPMRSLSLIIFDEIMVDKIKSAELTGFIYLDLQSIERANRLRALHSLPPLSALN